MDLTIFYELDESGSPVLDEYNKQVIRHRPESKTLADVLLVAELHAKNPAMHHVIDRFIELYTVTLQWDWFEQYQAWLARKADAELNAPALPIDTQDKTVLEQPLFSDLEPQRPELKTVEQYRQELLINGISIDEYIYRIKRENEVNSITVEVDGLIFDGDEESQRRMLASIHSAEESGDSKIMWKLADDSEVEITDTQLKKAHSLSIIKQGRIWTGADNAKS